MSSVSIWILSRRAKVVGEKSQRLEMNVVMGGICVMSIKSEPYIKTEKDVQDDIEKFVTKLVESLKIEGVDSNVYRKEF